MQSMELCNHPIIAGYDEIWPRFAQNAAQVRQREYSAIAVDLADAGYMSQGMAYGTQRLYIAAIPLQRGGQSGRRGPPFSRDYQHGRLGSFQNDYSLSPVVIGCSHSTPATVPRQEVFNIILDSSVAISPVRERTESAPA
jgi:hypothetical protein